MRQLSYAAALAGVLELVDEADSKSADRNIVRVRFPPPALENPREILINKGFRGFHVSSI